MTEILPILLKSREHAGPSERKELAKQIPKNLYFELADGSRKQVRELIHTDDANTTTLIQSEVYRTVIEGSTPVIGIRDALDTIQMNSNQLRVNYASAGVYAAEVDEGAEIPVYIDGYTAVTFTAKKYGARPLVTNELVSDGLFDIVTEEIKYAGQSLENRLNYAGLTEILENSGNEHDTTGSNQGVKAVATAIGTQQTNGFMPTSLIMHPEANAIVLQDYIPTGAYYQVGDSAKTGKVTAPVLGLKATTIGTSEGSSTYTWGYGSDGEIGMLLVDTNRGAKIGMRQDISVEQYDDPIRDLVGMSCTIRFDVETIQANGITRVEY